MRGYILLCLVSLAVAAPQGYNYATVSGSPSQSLQTQAQYGGSATSFIKDLQSVMAVQSVNAEPISAGAQQQHQQFPTAIAQFTSTGFGAEPQTQQQPQPRYLAPAIVASNSLLGASIYEQHHQKIAEPIVTKRFFLHSAPEEVEDELMQKTLTVGTPRKNYNVVFIKAPAKAAQRTSIKITPAAHEDKTVIYVLAKKHDASEVDAQVHEVATTTAKPEVYFIKYKTAEEAAHAQQTIQEQYDSLGGSSHVSNEGVARVTSVIGSLDAVNQAGVSGASTASGASHEPMQYAPSAPAGQPQQETVFVQQAQSGVQTQAHNGYLPPVRYY